MNPKGIRGYSVDLRTRIVALAVTGISSQAVADQFSVNVSTVQRYLQKQCLGTLQLTPISPGRPPLLTAVHETQLLKQVETHPHATLVEHARMLESATGLKVSFKSVDRAFARLNITHKKNAGRTRAQ